MEDTQLIIWDRETALTFSSLVVAAYAWITTEHFLVATAVGLAMYALLLTTYEICGYHRGWRTLSTTRLIFRSVLPRLIHALGMIRRT